MNYFSSTSLTRLFLLFLTPILLQCETDPFSTMTVWSNVDEASLPGLEIVIETGGVRREFRLADLRINDDGHLETPVFHVPNEGAARISATLANQNGPIASGSVTFTLRQDFVWGVGLFRSVHDFRDGCTACFGAESFSIDPEFRREPDEQFWIAWGGHPRGLVTRPVREHIPTATASATTASPPSAVRRVNHCDGSAFQTIVDPGRSL